MPITAKDRGIACAAIAAALLLAVSGCGGGEVGPGDEIDGTVSRIVDGDTIVANLGGREERVRYIGIDTPESVKPNVKDPDCFGPEASSENERLLPSGSPIRLVVGTEPRDRYGRLLAYVYRKDQGGQELFVNADLVRRGFADTLVFPPNTRHAGEFAQLRTRAARAGLGLWQRCR
jgi:micrococcal nuclease